MFIDQLIKEGALGSSLRSVERRREYFGDAVCLDASFAYEAFIISARRFEREDFPRLSFPHARTWVEWDDPSNQTTMGAFLQVGTLGLRVNEQVLTFQDILERLQHECPGSLIDPACFLNLSSYWRQGGKISKVPSLRLFLLGKDGELLTFGNGEFWVQLFIDDDEVNWKQDVLDKVDQVFNYVSCISFLALTRFFDCKALSNLFGEVGKT